MAGIADEIKASFKQGNAGVKLIYINLAVYLVIQILFIVYVLITPSSGVPKRYIFQTRFLEYLMVHTDVSVLVRRPWSLITYMFLHFDFLHILFNLIWLFLFSRIFLKFLNNKQLYSTYLLGGLAGALFLILSFNVFPGLDEHRPALGASASVSAIVIAISFYAPNYTVYFPIAGPVKLKYIAIVFILLDFLMIANTRTVDGLNTNAGGHIAHLGGAIYGYFFAIQLKKGKDIGKGFSSLMDNFATLFQRKPRMKVSYKSKASQLDDLEYNKQKSDNQKEIDRILDKIAKSGYDSLSKKEKEKLFKMSNKG